MKKSDEQYRDAMQIMARWGQAIACLGNGNDRDRDSAILRFELAYEVIWKYVQERVRDSGLEWNGPRQAFENAFRLGWIADEFLVDEILKARNTAVHVYREELADKLASRLAEFHRAMEALIEASRQP